MTIKWLTHQHLVHDDPEWPVITEVGVTGLHENLRSYVIWCTNCWKCLKWKTCINNEIHSDSTHMISIEWTSLQTLQYNSVCVCVRALTLSLLVFFHVCAKRLESCGSANKEEEKIKWCVCVCVRKRERERERKRKRGGETEMERDIDREH